MAIGPYAQWTLSQEARALLTRLARVRSFALVEPMLPAANLLPGTQDAIERHLIVGRRQLRKAVHDFLAWLRGPAARQATAAHAQRRYTFLKLRFNAVTTQFDLFNGRVGTPRGHRSSAISTAASVPRSGAPVPACRAAGPIRWRSSASRASA
jgi:hypothetical protein